MANRLTVQYKGEVVSTLAEKSDYKSTMQIPKIKKVVLNMDVGDAVPNAKNLDETVEELALISGQKPLTTKAKRPIANFRLREGMSIGTKVTFRDDRMYDFLNKLINVSLPRARNFHSVSTRSSDRRGNYTLGVKEQLISPGIGFDKINRIRGLDVVIVTTTQADEEAHKLLQRFGFPFAK